MKRIILLLTMLIMTNIVIGQCCLCGSCISTPVSVLCEPCFPDVESGSPEKWCGSIEKLYKRNENGVVEYYKTPECTDSPIDKTAFYADNNCALASSSLPELDCIDSDGDTICWNYYYYPSSGSVPPKTFYFSDAIGNILHTSFQPTGSLGMAVSDYASSNTNVTNQSLNAGMFSDAFWYSKNNDCEYVFMSELSNDTLFVESHFNNNQCCGPQTVFNLSSNPISGTTKIYTRYDYPESSSVLICGDSNLDQCVEVPAPEVVPTISNETNISIVDDNYLWISVNVTPSGSAPDLNGYMGFTIEVAPTGSSGDTWSFDLDTACETFTFFGQIQ